VTELRRRGRGLGLRRRGRGADRGVGVSRRLRPPALPRLSAGDEGITTLARGGVIALTPRLLQALQAASCPFCRQPWAEPATMAEIAAGEFAQFEVLRSFSRSIPFAYHRAAFHHFFGDPLLIS
jgi:hypothetical protein